MVEQTVLLTQSKWKDLALANRITIQVESDLQPVPATTDSEAEFREALTNLIFNAVDATPDGGRILLWTRADGSGVVREVSDTGVSMTEEVHKHGYSHIPPVVATSIA